MDLATVLNFYSGIREKFREVLFNTTGGVDLPSNIDTLDHLVIEQEDIIGKLYQEGAIYQEDDLVTDNRLDVFVSLKADNGDSLDNELSWKKLNDVHFENGKIIINASGLLTLDLESDGSETKNEFNLRFDRINNSHDIKVTIDSSADITDDTYVIALNAYCTSDSGKRAFVNYHSKTKTSFVINGSFSSGTNDNYEHETIRISIAISK